MICTFYSGTKTRRNLRPTTHFHFLPSLSLAFKLVSSSAYSSTLKMEAMCASETSVDFQRTAWRYITEDKTLLNLKKIESLPLLFLFLLDWRQGQVHLFLLILCKLMNPKQTVDLK
jgi:hypothetical protein